MLEIHDRLGQVSTASGGGVQQHATLDDRNQYLHDVNGQGKGNAPNVLLTRIRREKDVASSLCEGGGQETTGNERALQEEHGASGNEAAEEI